MNTKLTWGAVIVLVLLVILGGVYYWAVPRVVAPDEVEQIATSTPDQSDVAVTPDGTSGTTTATSSSITTKPVTKKINPRDPWQVLALYTDYLKAHNIEGVKSLSYQQSATCADSKKEKECFTIMDNVYALAKKIKSDDYPVKWEDGKQLVLLTPTIADNSLGRGYRQGIIIFTKTSAGDLKVLYFNPDRSWFVDTASTDTSAAVEEKLRLMMVDEDRDAVEDRLEACVSEPSSCKETNPAKRDTDGDGWWDGVERFFYK